MSAAVAVQAVVSGLALGAVFGLVGMGFSLVYRLTRVLAFAHGDLVVGSVFIGALAVVGSTPVAGGLSPAESAAMLLVVLAAGAGLSAIVYLVSVRPYLAGTDSRRGVLGWAAGGITAGLVVRTVLGLTFPAQAYALPDPFHLDELTGSGIVHLPGSATVPVRAFGVIAIGLVVAVLTERTLVRSRPGAAMRAVASDPEAAALVGVNIGRVVLIAFVVAGVLAGLAGALEAPGRALSVDSGVVLGLEGVAAALLGRLGSLGGAIVGGLALGIVDQLVVATPALGGGYADVVPLAVLVAVLAVRPEG